jgi:predicted PurR-regulated permease PerM
MKLIAKLIKVLIILLIILALSIFLYYQGWLKSHPLQAQINQFQEGKIRNWQDFINSFKKEEGLNLQLNELSTSAGEQIKISAQKAIEAGKVAQEFVSESIQTDESSEKNLGERAFEYGQYVYCKAVVEDWEEKINE